MAVRNGWTTVIRKQTNLLITKSSPTKHSDFVRACRLIGKTPIAIGDAGSNPA